MVKRRRVERELSFGMAAPQPDTLFKWLRVGTPKNSQHSKIQKLAGVIKVNSLISNISLLIGVCIVVVAKSSFEWWRELART